MGDFATRVKAIEQKKNEVAKQYEALLNRRRQELYAYLDRFGLISVSDDILCGMFSRLSEWVKTGHAELEELAKQGKKFRRAPRERAKSPTQATPTQSAKAATHA